MEKPPRAYGPGRFFVGDSACYIAGKSEGRFRVKLPRSFTAPVAQWIEQSRPKGKI